MRGKNPRLPFAVLILALIFRRKKSSQEETTRESRSKPFPIPEILKKSVTTIDMAKSRDRLRLASLERDIVGDALTKIYEAEAKGQITEIERNQLMQHYKTDLKRVDGEIDTQKKIVDLYELESAKEDLLKSFQEKMMEIDLRINQIRPSINTLTTSKAESIPPQPAPSKAEMTTTTPPQSNENKERPPKEKPRNKAEEKLETIREEVLKAMERLEQIEAEG